MKMKKKSNKGFSLIELIIAIAILVILTGLLAPQFMKYIEKSRLAKDLQALDSVYTAVQGSIADEKAYTALVAKHKDSIEEGVKLESILALANAQNDEDKDAFADELNTILGIKTEDLKFQSKVANALEGGGDIYISIDPQMQVGVWYGTEDNYFNDLGLKVSLKVGVVKATAANVEQKQE